MKYLIFFFFFSTCAFSQSIEVINTGTVNGDSLIDVIQIDTINAVIIKKTFKGQLKEEARNEQINQIHEIDKETAYIEDRLEVLRKKRKAIIKAWKIKNNEL